VSLWSSTACEIFFISHFLYNLFTMSHLFVLTYDMLTFLCFRSSNKDPGAGRVESLSMKEHTGWISTTHLFIVWGLLRST